jgi:hypothetical protein
MRAFPLNLVWRTGWQRSDNGGCTWCAAGTGRVSDGPKEQPGVIARRVRRAPRVLESLDSDGETRQ